MNTALGIGKSGHVAMYEVSDRDLPVGSTLGSPKAFTVIQSTGAIQEVWSVDHGVSLFGAVALRHFDGETGMLLDQIHPGTFRIHPGHQEHEYTLINELEVHETAFALNCAEERREEVSLPAVYFCVELRNRGSRARKIHSYAFADLRGKTAHDLAVEYDEDLNALVIWNRSRPEQARIVGCSRPPESYEVTDDAARPIAQDAPGILPNRIHSRGEIGVFHHSFCLEPEECLRFNYLLSFSPEGEKEARAVYRSCPPADQALEHTEGHYNDLLSRAMVLTPNPEVNRGALWAKVDMLRVQMKAPTGWCFTNDPLDSNHSVGRDTAWYAFGSDYLSPRFSRKSLLAYVRSQKESGLMVEYYDVRTGETEDYGLNVNDNTPLLILALWHHYKVTGDESFLKEIYPAAEKAARYLLSQRNEQGLIWCTAEGTGAHGIVGWRNIIKGCRISGASTEVNSECYAAIQTVAEMARLMDCHDDSREFATEAENLKTTINEHLYNPDNGLYYRNIDVDGCPCADVTCDLVFPVIFGVASKEVGANIVRRLSSRDFWTESGMRTVSRDALDYSPTASSGLLGGVWVGVSFWYAFAAAAYTPEFMNHALSSTFKSYSSDPHRNNTVPGQFSEWLHGETLVNRGMMLSPWFPPRYLWAAVEGVAGCSFNAESLQVRPSLAPDWKWLAVKNLPYRDQWVTFFAARAPELQLYSNLHFQASDTIPYHTFEEDVSASIRADGETISVLGFRTGDDLVLFLGSADERTIVTSVRVDLDLEGEYRCCQYDTIMDEWNDHGLVSAQDLQRGITLHVEERGFIILDLKQEA